MQSIVSAVLSAIRTNSRTIEQLTSVTTLNDSDSFEVSGGKRVTYGVLRDLIASLSSTGQDSLKNLIAKCELKSVSITVTEGSATLQISSVGKSISTSIPIATTSDPGLMTAADKVKLQSAYDTAQTAKDTADTAKSKAEDAYTRATEAESAAKAVVDMKGQRNGLASLDDTGKVPISQLPSYVNDVVEFNAMVSGIATQLNPSPFASTDGGCMVVYDNVNCVFLLAVSTFNYTREEWVELRRPLTQIESIPSAQADISSDIISPWVIINGESRLDASQFSYYRDWADADLFGTHTQDGYCVPESDKVYICTSDNKTFRWSGSSLVTIGSDLALGHTANTAFPGDEGANLNAYVYASQAEQNEIIAEHQNLIHGLSIVPFNGTFKTQFGAQIMRPVSGVWFTGSSFMFVTMLAGLTDSDYLDINGEIRTDRIFRKGNELYRWNGKDLVKVGGDSVGNTYNVTIEIPLETGEYYSDLLAEDQTHNVLQAVYDKGIAALGLQLTFAIAPGSWKTYQYVGPNTTDDQFVKKPKENWVDLAGMSAGAESVINVNHLCGEGALQFGAYTLESAIKAISDKEAESGIKYRKGGMIITYKVGDGKWESKQLVQSVNSFNVPGAWEPFGSAKGNEIQASDKPVKEGKDAFSTGGAYDRIPTKHETIQEDGKVTIKLLNEGGQEVMDPIEFLSAQGGGGNTGGTIVSLGFKNSPLYGALGSSLKAKLAIRSVTMVGAVETDNGIEKIEIIDTASNSVVFQQNLRKPSSLSLNDYSFELDFTPYFTVAGQKKFRIVATDDTGETGSKTINVVAEDLTLRCTQQLSQTIAPTDTQAIVEMYAFDNNQSEGGIKATVDILVDGEWKNVQTEVVGNSFSRTATFNAVELGLSHGAYLIRMQGESVDSGVKGNTVYSTVMCVDPASDETLIALRYNDTAGGTVRLFDTLSFDIAAYRKVNGSRESALVDVYIGEQKITQVNVSAERSVNVRKQISGYKQGDILTLQGRFGASVSPSVDVVVDGSALDISMKAGEAIHLDFASRSNTESDKTISDRGYTMQVNGANWTTNGFNEYLGLGSLRIAENVTAELPYTPFAHSNIEQVGAAVQFKIATRNIRDAEARLISCYDPESGTGFYVCGNKAAIFCKNGVTGAGKAAEERKFECGEMHTIAVVVEPQSLYQERAGTKYSMLKLYIDGEESASIGYVPGTGAILSNENVKFNGRDGDLYLYYFLAYRSHYEWAQAFDNYLVKGHDTEAMVQEYNRENVLVSQTAEGSTAMRPSHTALWSRGIRYMINVAPQETFDIFDHGNGSDDNGLTTSPKFTGLTHFFYDPVHPWRSFKAVNVTKKRQGTTSSTRPQKNEDDDYSKATITPLYPEYASDAELRAMLSAEDLKDIADTFALFNIGYIRIGRNSMPIKRAMNKIDFSDSSCANNGGVCDMMNDTFRAIGDKYLTPAQKFFDGTWEQKGVKLEGLQINHSIENFPCAIFRSNSETLQNVFFHARGSYMESKKEQAALGFRDVSGYNKGCLNYGDFKELFTAPGQSLDVFVANADKSSWEYPQNFEKALSDSNPAHNVIVISEYCGRNFKVFRRTAPGAEWRETTGSMRMVGGKWQVSGDLRNPVTGVELLSYTGMCWWKGVKTVEDMMAMQTTKSSWVSKLVEKGWVSGTEFPAWTAYFECLIEDDQLAIDYASGRKVPYELFNTLRFFASVDYSELPESEWKARWKSGAWKYMSIESVDAYHIFTDYLAAVDQRAKNMQPMWFLEEGCSIVNGVYTGTDDGMEPMRMYLNKVYDCDTCNGKDNEGGETIDPETDPDKATNEEEGYKNPYAGWGSILFNCIAGCKKELVITGHYDANAKAWPSTSLMNVASAMRSAQWTRSDGKSLTPFSPDGARFYFIEQRILKWPKKVTTYDCERKYISHTATANKIYFYANQGSGRTSLARFINQRWLVRDGFYQTGGFFAGPMTMRINCKPDARVHITAAERGYFAIGYENVGTTTESVFLEKGESYSFSDFSKVDGTSLYLYQTQRMSKIDLSELTINGADFTKCELLEELIIGSDTYVEKPMGSYATQTDLPIGNLPFLRVIDIRNTPISSVNAAECPRLAHVYAQGSQLAKLTIAKTSPINDINLPETMTEIDLQYLPSLTYTGLASLDGLRISAYAKVKNLRVEHSPKVDAVVLLKHITEAINSALERVRIDGQSLKGNATELLTIINRGIKGLDEGGQANKQRPVIIGTYELTQLLEQEEIERIESSIEGITIDIAVEAFTDAMDDVNADFYSGQCEVEKVSLDNIGSHMLYYNGESAEDYIGSQILAEMPISEIINQQ